MGGISSDDSGALQKLREKLAQHERKQEKMKSVNAFYHKHGTLDGCPLLSAEEAEKIKAAMARDWRANPKPYNSYRLSNNNQTIRDVKARIAELEAKQSSPAPEGWSFEGGRVVMNQEENRIQILFDGKADRFFRPAQVCHNEVGGQGVQATLDTLDGGVSQNLRLSRRLE